MEDATPPITEHPTINVVPQVAMDEAPTPSSKGGAPTHLLTIVILLDPSQSNSSSSILAPSPTPSDWSLSSTLTPSSSPARTQCPRNPTPECTEPIEPPAPTTPPPSVSTPSIPNDSPLASCTQLLDTEMEWHMFPPNWCLQYIPWDSEHAYPLPLFQQDTYEGCTRAKALITRHKLVGGQPSTDAPIKSEPGPSCITRPRKRVHLLPPSSSSSPVPENSPLPSTSRTLSMPDDSTLAIALAIRDAIVAAVEAFDQTLEEHGLSSKAKGKHRKHD
ncbi:hypothetical protein EDD15DRAFT_2359675 [Pisolithus albus]|nr:hypothetical protein EDD15DRAFT_2359675 [Pisolithus albus]